MMLRHSDFRAQRQKSDSEPEDPSPQAANLRQQNQPGRRKEHKKTTCSNQVHGAEAKMGQGPVHGNNTATMSAGEDRIRRLRGIGSPGVVVLKTP